MAPEGTGYLGLEPYDVYWSRVRDMYSPFENGMKSGTARVFDHQIPGKIGEIHTYFLFERKAKVVVSVVARVCLFLGRGPLQCTCVEQL